MLLYDCHILNEPTSRLYESLIRPKNYAPRARKHLQDILADFAKRVPKENTVTLRESEVLTNEWVFKEPTDVEFLDAYPEVRPSTKHAMGKFSSLFGGRSSKNNVSASTTACVRISRSASTRASSACSS